MRSWASFLTLFCFFLSLAEIVFKHKLLCQSFLLKFIRTSQCTLYIITFLAHISRFFFDFFNFVGCLIELLLHLTLELVSLAAKSFFVFLLCVELGFELADLGTQGVSYGELVILVKFLGHVSLYLNIKVLL